MEGPLWGGWELSQLPGGNVCTCGQSAGSAAVAKDHCIWSVCCSYVRPEFVEEDQPPQLHIEAVRAWGGWAGQVGWLVLLEWSDVPELVTGHWQPGRSALGGLKQNTSPCPCFRAATLSWSCCWRSGRSSTCPTTRTCR